MTIDTLDKIIGPASMLSMIIAPIKENILLNPAFGWCPTTQTLDGCQYSTSQLPDLLEDITLYQWGSGALLNNTDLYIFDVEPISGGIANVAFSNSSFYSAPEFGLFLQDSERSSYSTSLGLTFAQSKVLLNRNVTAEAAEISNLARSQSLLNPDNIHEFFLDYTLGEYSTLKKRFGLVSNE